MYTLYVYDIYIYNDSKKKEEMIINIIRVNTIPLITKISFGGIPNSRNALLLQIFLKRAAKPSAGTFSGALLNLTWLHQSLPAQTFSGNLNRNPVEPHLAAPKAPRPSPELSPEPC